DPTRCGPVVSGLGRWAVDSGGVQRSAHESCVAIQCPCGLVEANVAGDGSVKFSSVPAFAFALDAVIDVPGLGPLNVDIGYGGAFYAFVAASRFGLDVRRSATRDLVDAADSVSKAAKAQVRLDHPDD